MRMSTDYKNEILQKQDMMFLSWNLKVKRKIDHTMNQIPSKNGKLEFLYLSKQVLGVLFRKHSSKIMEDLQGEHQNDTRMSSYTDPRPHTKFHHVLGYKTV